MHAAKQQAASTGLGSVIYYPHPDHGRVALAPGVYLAGHAPGKEPLRKVGYHPVGFICLPGRLRLPDGLGQHRFPFGPRIYRPIAQAAAALAQAEMAGVIQTPRVRHSDGQKAISADHEDDGAGVGPLRPVRGVYGYGRSIQAQGLTVTHPVALAEGGRAVVGG